LCTCAAAEEGVSQCVIVCVVSFFVKESDEKICSSLGVILPLCRGSRRVAGRLAALSTSKTAEVKGQTYCDDSGAYLLKK